MLGQLQIVRRGSQAHWFLRFHGSLVSMKRRCRAISSSGVPMSTKPEQLAASPWDIRDGLVGGNDRVFNHGDFVLGFLPGVARDHGAVFRPRRLDESAKR